MLDTLNQPSQQTIRTSDMTVHIQENIASLVHIFTESDGGGSKNNTNDYGKYDYGNCDYGNADYD